MTNTSLLRAAAATIALLGLCHSPVTFAQAATPSAKKSTKAPTPSPWIPPDSADNVTELPKRYAGTSQKDVMAEIERTAPKLVRGEFETTNAFEERAQNLTAQFAAKYSSVAFTLEDAKFVYNADKSAFQQKQYGGYHCQEEDAYLICSLDKLSHEFRNVLGGNAYGATTEVSKIRSVDFAIRLPKANVAASGIFAKDPQVRRSYELGFEIPYEVDQARKNAGKPIRALFVGSVPEPKSFDLTTLFSAPTFENPTQIWVTAKAVPFELKYVLFYFFDTGVVISRVAR